MDSSILRKTLALLALTAATSAIAASFNCANAVSAKERFICAEPRISAIDEVLALTYRNSLVGLSSRAIERVRTGQRAWLAYWPRACSQAQTTIKLDKDSVKCVANQYEGRVAELKVKNLLNDKFRLYWVVSFDVLSSDKDDEYGPAKHEIKFPQLDILNPQDPMVSRVLKINEWLGHDLSIWKSGLNNQSDSSDAIDVVALTGDILKRSEHSEFYGHGANHPVSAASASYYKIGQDRVLRVQDIFVDGRWVDVVVEIAYRQLANALKDMLQVEKKDLREMVQDISHWRLEKDGLGLHFNVYQVAPYSEGPQSVEVPWRTLSGHLTGYAKQQIQQITAFK